MLKIIADTREQTPLTFEGYEDALVYRDKLDCGDYSLFSHDMPGDDHSIIVERKKDCLELCTNLGSAWDRFEKEAALLAEYKHKMILVCAPNNFESLYKMERTKMNPAFVSKQLNTLYLEYGIPTFFFYNHQQAEEFMYRMFRRVKQLTDE
jgi:ERCC4-type nuclease